VKKTPVKSEINAIMMLPRSMRVSVMLDYVEEKQTAVVNICGKSKATVSRTIDNLMTSRFVDEAAYKIFKTKLKKLCPDQDTIFRKDH
jgi:hypothetical protein